MKDGGPAFPRDTQLEIHLNEFQSAGSPGMSLRDYFAGQALRELRMSDPAYDWQKLARRAYEYADAMLAEREKE